MGSYAAHKAQQADDLERRVVALKTERDSCRRTLESIVAMCDHGFEDSQDAQFVVIKSAAQVALERSAT